MALGAILVLFLVLALWGIGSPSVPSKPWPGGDLAAVITPDGPVDRLYFNVVTPEQTTVAQAACEGPGGTWARGRTLYTTTNFNSWSYLDLPCRGRIRLLVISDAAIGEVYLFDGFQKRGVKDVQVESGDPSGLFDEQGLLNEPPNYFYGAVYDELTYAKTAYQYLTLSKPFLHFDHPPLGKDLIALGISAAGNSPLGWRLPQVASGALLLVVIYLIGLRLGGTRTGLLAALLLALTPLHYTYSRLALLDVHLVLFVALAVLFFLRSERRLSLFLAFAFLGAATAVKWTALPLFPTFLVLLLVRRRQMNLRKYAPFALGGILAAGLIYLASYAPYYTAGLGLNDVLGEQCCGPRSIFGFHTTPLLYDLLDSWHSSWWSWPLLPWVPSPYTSLSVGGSVSAVQALGNPILAWMALPVMAWALWKGVPLLRRKSPPGPADQETWDLLTLSVSFFAMWLLLSFTSRATYFYHYYSPLVLSLPVLAFWLGKQPVRSRYLFVLIAALFFLALLRPALGMWM